jgi:subtilisin family serine protease
MSAPDVAGGTNAAAPAIARVARAIGHVSAPDMTGDSPQPWPFRPRLARTADRPPQPCPGDRPRDVTVPAASTRRRIARVASQPDRPPPDRPPPDGPQPDKPERRPLPAWSLSASGVHRIPLPLESPQQITREWAWGGSTGKGVRVCILDSGVERGHPLVGELDGAVVVEANADAEGGFAVRDDDEDDACGHGTACAGIVRALAPDASLFSVRVLGAGFKGSGKVLLEGLRWSVEQGFDVINMSLSTTKRELAALLHELADTAYFQRTVLVASAHNMPVESFPWKFSSVISVGSHELPDPLAYFYNPSPPVEFFARGVDVDVAWLGGGSLRSTGNSFATPHVSAICALVLGKHPQLTPFQLKNVLYLTSNNVGGAE